MGKYFENSSTFSYTWEQLITAFWRRYPNPHSSHVLSEDTLDREFRGDCLFTRRILTKTNRAPKWGERFVKSSIVAIVEESYLDLKTRILTTYSRNIGYNRIMSVTERVEYTPDPDHPGQTVANRRAWIESQMYGFRRPIEAFGLDRFRNNCSKAVSGFNFVLQNLYAQQLKRKGDVFHTAAIHSIPTLREKAKKAGEIARKSAEKISLVSTSANVDS